MADTKESSQEHGSLSSLFSAVSQSYATFRPQYPPHIYQRILDYAQLPRLGLAVDLGSGSGQATRALAQRFDRVVGIDASAEQLSQAELPSNVELRQGTAENTGLPPSSVDLVTAAAALHWFDIPAAYREARRILKPGGAFAAWTYAGMECRWIPEQPEAERLRRQIMCEEFFPFFHPRLQGLLTRGYEGDEPSSSDFAESERVICEMEVELTVAQMVGMVRTWSAYSPYVAAHGEAATAERLERYRRELLAALGVPDEHTPVRQAWPVDMVLARMPRPLSGGDGDS